MKIPITLQDEFINTAFEDASSPHNGAIFFSGPKAKRKACKMSRSNLEKYRTVVDTVALQKFNKFQPHYFGKKATFSLQEAYFIGDCISESFANNASGSVRVYLDGVKPHGTFNRVEIATLLKNDKITDFLVYDASPRNNKIQPFEEMRMSKDELRNYIDQTIKIVPFRDIGQSLVTKKTSPSPQAC